MIGLGNGLAQIDFDNKSNERTGRWTWEEHIKFMDGKFININISLINKYIILAMRLYGKDWKRVEQHIGTRSGA